VIKSHDVGTIQYIEWLILIDRVQPSLIAGVHQSALRGPRSLRARVCGGRWVTNGLREKVAQAEAEADERVAQAQAEAEAEREARREVEVR
jgi:hypothetical protein